MDEDGPQMLTVYPGDLEVGDMLEEGRFVIRKPHPCCGFYEVPHGVFRDGEFHDVEWSHYSPSHHLRVMRGLPDAPVDYETRPGGEHFRDPTDHRLDESFVGLQRPFDQDPDWRKVTQADLA